MLARRHPTKEGNGTDHGNCIIQQHCARVCYTFKGHKIHKSMSTTYADCQGNAQTNMQQFVVQGRILADYYRNKTIIIFTDYLASNMYIRAAEIPQMLKIGANDKSNHIQFA
jgi:hypothetical protein